MSLDGQVLVIAFCAVALKLFLWSSEEEVAGADVEPDRQDLPHFADSELRIRAEALPGVESIAAATLRRGLDR
jgi:hypothetical protein